MGKGKLLFSRLTGLCATLLIFFIVPNIAFAFTSADADLNSRVAKIETATTTAQSAGDNAWMLICAALVLLMTGPGLALFYGGLVRQKNVLSTIMQSLILMGIVTVLWAIFGYSIAFAEGTPFFGKLQYVFLRGVGSEPNAAYAATIPQQTFMIYQLMFAIITPALITGAFAERIKFSSMIVFTTLWSTLVYFPLAHMVWGKGGFFNAALGGRFPALDFAGGTVVHISSGIAALVCALYLGKRIGYPETQPNPHNLVLSIIGACLLWVGWFGFNAGSALSSGSLATSAFVATHFAAAAAALGWISIEWIRTGKPTALGFISGAVAGLVGITPASGFVTPMSALIIGLIAGVGCYIAVTELKTLFGYDDALDAFGVHGVGGTIGAILTGVFATSLINPIFKDASGNSLPVGAIDGNASQIINQLIAIGVTVLISVVGSYLILKIVDLVIGVRVTETEELEGLDRLHGHEAYSIFPDLEFAEIHANPEAVVTGFEKGMAAAAESG